MALRQTTYHIRLADGRTLACDPTGSPVFYPGSRLEGRSAADTARRLGLRLIAPDRPGFGESTFQPGRTIGAWATDVAELADQIALGRFAIVGVSGGAPLPAPLAFPTASGAWRCRGPGTGRGQATRSRYGHPQEWQLASLHPLLSSPP